MRELWAEYHDLLISLNATKWQRIKTLIWDGRRNLLTASLTGFGRAIGEVGAIMIVGGNIDHATRVLTTAIALETDKGDFALTLGLGFGGQHGDPLVVPNRERGALVSITFPLTLSQVRVHRRGKNLLGPIDLTLSKGGPLIVIGPNGSGKTTLLRVMHGIERISNGTLNRTSHDPEKHAYVFQQPAVLLRSVLQNLAYPLLLAGSPKPELESACDQWLAVIGMSDMTNLPATRLSGGERQKLANARGTV